ncbi:anthranilate synthase component I family protein [Streptomyces sp. MST-110588]|uniref:anthranilate synthase component I family protein n=1 Tax=Streptomyces sp. MST-110588 TaxID=2833628 RepID=UPI001F5DF69C|nr:anthranilate synthase component I family protein [Streptomyces sp. MST-110588]UNO41489.1 anthranilate synthase component I family protein [Streptomyces sp. MST-110588]
MAFTTRVDAGTGAASGAGQTPGTPFAVRVTSSELPSHDPLHLYEALAGPLGAEEVFLFESLAGPEKDRRSAVVGFGRLAEIRVYARHVEIAGPAALRGAVLAVADAAGMTADPGATGATTGAGEHAADAADAADTSNAADAAHGADADAAVARRFDRPEQLWELLRRAQELFAVETDVPRDTYAFGFLTTLAYEAAWHMDELPARESSRGGPDMTFTLVRDTVWYDRLTGETRHRAARAEVFPPAPPLDLAAHAEAAARAPRGEEAPQAPAPRSVRDSVARETFLDWARRCLEHIRIGDIYQIQIGHRIDVETELTPVEVYRRLRSRNPSPYMYLMPRADQTVIGASPELFFRTEGDEILMRPIAGTTRRAESAEENQRRIKEMLASTKEQAEHVMLVDLCRNDIGRVCRPGTLAVDDLMTVEAYSHVFHIVSTVAGKLEDDADVWRSLCATFPAGTMTGAPKLRAMEIIDGIEEEPRGLYAGAVGLIDVRGWSELALCIRTIVHDGRTYSTQSSAGVVAESSPEGEWNETLAKMGAAYWALTGEELS